MSDIDITTAPPREDGPHPASATAPTVGDQSLERIAQAFETGMRRWELIIYPALFAFVLLAAYGFYMVYSLTRDVDRLSNDINRMTEAVAPAMTGMNRNMESISADVHQMNVTTGNMAAAIHHMGASIWDLNRNISTPMDAFNSMMPWGSAGPAYTMPPPMMPVYYPPMPAVMQAPEAAAIQPQVGSPQDAARPDAPKAQ